MRTKSILTYDSFYLVGIKGVAMTSLVQCLVDAKKTIRGSDVEEEFVTQPILNSLKVPIDIGFENKIPDTTECVVYTAAHQALQNPQVIQAKKRKIPIYSHAEALASLFNQKQGIAVCGVGGKSSVSAMIAWVLWHTNHKASFSVGVGNIPGIGKTGQWNEKSPYFVAEADDYVVDPSAPEKKHEIIPRFSYLYPQITVCTNMKFDHPDVYRNFDHTKPVFTSFFNQIKTDGTVIINRDDGPLFEIAQKVAQSKSKQLKLVTFGEHPNSDLRLLTIKSRSGKTTATLKMNNATHQISLPLPGKFNIKNAMATILACHEIDISLEKTCQLLANFQSTKRRFEYIGTKNGVVYYDDYAHHPHEVAAAIQAIKNWYPDHQVVIAFQSHTYSRTKELFSEFVAALSQAKHVVMIDIFSSDREKNDPSVSSDILCTALKEKNPDHTVRNVNTIKNLANYCKKLPSKTVVLTLGAGDIYQVHCLIK